MNSSEKKVLFMGTPEYARVVLSELFDKGYNVISVFTQQDKPKGRHMIVTPSPVKIFAEEKNIPVFQPSSLKEEASIKMLDELSPDVIVVAAYGKILPTYFIHYPKYGCINAHASLLPHLRGAAPIQRSIINGDKVTGVTSMLMDEGIDTGDIISQTSIEITDTDDYGTIHDKLADAAGNIMVKSLHQIFNGEIITVKQNDHDSSYANKITKNDCVIDFSSTAKRIFDQIRGLSPSPLAFTHTQSGRIIKIERSIITDRQSNTKPGTVTSIQNNGFTVACSDKDLLITSVKPEGKKTMDAPDFIRGRGISINEMFI